MSFVCYKEHLSQKKKNDLLPHRKLNQKSRNILLSKTIKFSIIKLVLLTLLLNCFTFTNARYSSQVPFERINKIENQKQEQFSFQTQPPSKWLLKHIQKQNATKREDISEFEKERMWKMRQRQVFLKKEQEYLQRRYLQGGSSGASQPPTPSPTPVIINQCTEYHDPSTKKICKSCNNQQQNYQLLIVREGLVICAVMTSVTEQLGQQSGPAQTTTTIQSCAINETVYPELAVQLTKIKETLGWSNQTIFWKYQSAIGAGTSSFCYNATIFQTSDSGQDICDTKQPTASINSDNYEIAVLSQSLSYCGTCNRPNYTTEIVTYHSQFGFFSVTCSALTTDCSKTEFYNSATNKCEECSSRFKNCGGCNSTQCLLCLNNFYWNNYTTQVSSLGYWQGECVLETCPTGYCQSPSLHQCVKQTIADKCLKCAEITSTIGSYECQKCQRGYYIELGKCILIPTSTYTGNFIVESGTPYLRDDMQTPLVTELSTTDPMPLLAFVISQLHNLTDVRSVDANIYLTRGDHFFFFCSSDENSYFGTPNTNHLANYCSNMTLYRPDFQNDNVVINIEPLWCSLRSAFTQYNDTDFSSMCVDFALGHSKPTIYVNSQYEYFNISGKMSIKNLKFSGVNALAAAADSSGNNIIPTLLCKSSTTLFGYEGTMKLTVVNPINLDLDYTCIDTEYTGSTIPATSKLNTTCVRNSKAQFNTERRSTLSCGGQFYDSDYFTTSNTYIPGAMYYNKRRAALFNLYSFPQHGTIRNSTPELYIENCEFEYFLKSYEALIFVENSIFTKTEILMKKYQDQIFQDEKKTFYIHDGWDRGAKISIKNSIVKDSRFCRGMIFYRKPYYETTGTISILNMTSFYNSWREKLDSGSYIIIQSSTLQNLNAFDNVTALALYNGKTVSFTTSSQVLESFDLQYFLHKGIIINVEDFGGRIEIIDSTITRNTYFIPEIYYKNQLSSFIPSISEFQDTLTTLEFQLSHCDQSTKTDKYFFGDGISQSNDLDSYFNLFERLGVIYISRNRERVIIRGNSFTKNIAPFGGALTINSMDWTKGNNSFVIIQNNNFEFNMAYISGNSIYIRNTQKEANISSVCGGVIIQNNRFDGNVGLKIHNGGAVSGYCELLTNSQLEDYEYTSSYKAFNSTRSDRLATISIECLSCGLSLTILANYFNIEDNDFFENYSGMKGTAVYVRQMSNVRINNCTFVQNGPVYAVIEYLNSPYVQFFSKRSMSYYDANCIDELQYLDSCNEENMILLYPRVQGAVYVSFCQSSLCILTKNQNLEISDSKFSKNDVGPVFDLKMTSPLSSQIFIVGGFNNSITTCDFQDNRGNFNYFTAADKSATFAYFPSHYFLHHQASLVVILIEPDSTKYVPTYKTTVDSCQFFRNKHVTPLGLTTNQVYLGSLIWMKGSLDDSNVFVSILTVQNSLFRDNYALDQPGLVAVQQGALLAYRNTFLNIGILKSETFTGTKTAMNITNFPFNSYTHLYLQSRGALVIFIEYALSNNQTQQIINNTFSHIFTVTAGALYCVIDKNYLLLSGNQYNYLVSTSQGGAIYARTNFPTATMQLEKEQFNHIFSLTTGAITVSPLGVNLFHFIMSNSNFTNTYSDMGSALYLTNAGKVFINSSFMTTTTSFQQLSDKICIVQTSFKQYNWAFSSLVNMEYLRSLFSSSIPTTGYIYLERAINSQEVVFAGKTLFSKVSTNINYAEIVNCQFTNGKATKYSVLYAFQSKVLIYNELGNERVIENNYQTSSGVIGLEGSIMNGSNLQIIGNIALNQGSMMSMTSSVVTLIHTTFVNNTAGTIGGLYIQTDSTFNCTYCLFLGNTAVDSPTLFADSNRNTIITLLYSNFTANTANLNLMSFLYSNVNLKHSLFIDNVAERVNNGITMINSQAYLFNITVNYTIPNFLANQGIAVDSGFFNLNYQSMIKISASKLLNMRGALAAVLYSTGYSAVMLSSGTLIQNAYSSSGFVIYSVLANQVMIDNSVFLNNSQIDIYSDKTPTHIYNSEFIQGNKQFIYGVQTSIIVENSTFRDGINQQIDGKAIYCACYNLTILNSTFSNLSAVQGGALYLTSANAQSNFTLKNNIFKVNYAQIGGAIYIQDAANMSLISNLFQQNHAEVIIPITAASAKLTPVSRGLGGAIYYGCLNDMLTSSGCNLSLSEMNIFQGNAAQHDGGAIIFISKPYLDDKTNIFRDNLALYGANFASYPARIRVEFINSLDLSNSTNKTLRRLQQDYEFLPDTHFQDKWSKLLLRTLETDTILNSGTSFNFNVYIIDQNDEVYSTDSTSKARLMYRGTQKVVLTNNEVVAFRGIYKFRNCEVIAEPGSALSFQLEITGLQTYGNSLDFLEVPIELQAQFRKCESGEEYTSDGRCVTCTKGYYLYEPPKTITPCKECHPQGLCYGGNVVSVKAGYWRSSNTSENIMECPNSEACLEGNQSLPQGKCSTGYTGIVCGVCDDHYSKVKTFKCAGCPDRIRNIVQISFMIAIGIVVVGLMVRSTLLGADKDKPVYSTYLKIITNHFQILGAISNIDYNWPTEIEKLQESQQTVSSVSDQFFSFDCFLIGDGHDDGLPVYYEKLIMFGFLPMILAGVDLFFWWVVCCIKKDYSQMRSKFTSTLVVLLFLVHPNICKEMFMNFNCFKVDNDYRLREYPDSICYEGTHRLIMLGVAVPSVILWAIGIPLFALLLLIINRKWLLKMDEGTITEEDAEAIKQVKMKYGFLFAGYRSRTFFWEILILYRKVAIIMATVFLSTISAEAQILIAMFIIVINMMLHIRYQPYYTDTLNRMEAYSLQVAAITMYSGMFYVTGSHYQYMENDGLKWFFLVCLAIPNVVFLIYWAFHMRMELLKEVHKRNKPKLFKFVSCMHPDRFYEKYMKQDAMKEKQVIITKGEEPQNAAAHQLDTSQQKDQSHNNEEEIIGPEDIRMVFVTQNEHLRNFESQNQLLGEPVSSPMGMGLQDKFRIKINQIKRDRYIKQQSDFSLTSSRKHDKVHPIEVPLESFGPSARAEVTQRGGAQSLRSYEFTESNRSVSGEEQLIVRKPFKRKRDQIFEQQRNSYKQPQNQTMSQKKEQQSMEDRTLPNSQEKYLIEDDVDHEDLKLEDKSSSSITE